MAEDDSPAQQEPTEDVAADSEPEQFRPLVTRRDFLIGSGAGAVAVGVVAGAGIAASQAGRQATVPQVVQTAPGGPAVVAPGVAPQIAGQPAAAATAALPASMRRVSLNIDGAKHEAVVDVRESLWETMVYKLGMAGANLGCDRAQCGACTVSVDGRAVNGCTVLTARLGRGQKILTAEGLATGPGLAGLHPIQRAYWQEGGFQCGICTRGFILSTHALLEVNKSPTRDQIREALAGNICRCGEYAKIYVAVEKAAAEMRKA